jgi:general secretion pathway protein I
MLALAIMAGVVLTVLASVNYHLGIIAVERDSMTLTLLARMRMTELEQTPLQETSEGTFAPAHPEIAWRAELTNTELASLRKLVLKVQRTTDKREVTLVRYVLK